jgi:8-oxo-dGTP pyrophosphatase MutT (NUDIX family)
MRSTLSIESRIEALATDPALPARVKAVLENGHGGRDAGTRMSPQLTYGRHAGPAPYTARAAAVMLLLFRRDGRWHLPLTERPMSLPHHGGQISLPGGAIDDGESAGDAAVRELREELGVASSVKLLGHLEECYVFASDFSITPWLGLVEDEPKWEPHAGEVQSVLELPIQELLREEAIGSVTIERGPLTFHAPCFCFGKARIWGATSMILSEFASVLRGCAA